MVVAPVRRRLRNLPRGGHDYRKLYAAYKARPRTSDRPPDGHPGQDRQGLDPRRRVRGRNSTHQIKKMTKKQMLELRDRLHCTTRSRRSMEDDNPPYFKLGPTRSSTST